MRNTFLPLFVIALAVFLGSCGTSRNPVDASSSSSEGSSSSLGVSSSSSEVPGSGFVAWNGTSYVDESGQKLRLRGMAFGNQVWFANEPSPDHHSEIDFIRLRTMGLNAVRFYLSYKFFEDDTSPYSYQQSGFDWLDSNFAWAERHGVYLILNMHVPQGGFQSNGEGGALWDEATNQDRLAALWFTLAQRYGGKAKLAAYDLVNEPVTTQGKSQWQSLAQRLIDTIRTVDTTHLIFVERMNGIIGGNWSNDADMNFVDVQDPANKTGLTFHIYSPIEFTHQNTSWTTFGDGGSYPDSTLLQVGETKWQTATHNSPRIGAGTTDWAYYQGVTFLIADSLWQLGKPTLTCQAVNTGTVWFDDLVVEEVDAQGVVLDTVVQIKATETTGWYFWSQNESGAATLAQSQGKEGGAAWQITGTTSDANYSNNALRFVVKQGSRYRANGWMRGTNVPDAAKCLIRLDLEQALTPFHLRDSAYLDSEVERYMQAIRARNTFGYLGEWGTYKETFAPGKGGQQWVQDMLDIAESKGLAWTYHTWHEDAFGLYYGNSTIDPSQANQPLIDLFTERFGQ